MKSKSRCLLTFFTSSLVALALSGCSSGVFSPNGPAANRIALLGYFLFALAGAVFIFVVGFLAVAVFRKREDEPDKQAPPPKGSLTFIVISSVVMPVVVLLIVLVSTLLTMRYLSSDVRQADVVIEVTGNRFWWDVHYPELDVVTANEIHIPTEQRVLLKLRSTDVIHSFWVPELNGKTDMIPGQVNNLWLEADNAGTYQGLCTEYCGVQHARMLFKVIAQPEDAFNEWVAQQQEPALQPVTAEQQQGYLIFLDKCGACHAVDGTNATGNLGPDLTHFNSRQTLGAGIAQNNRGNLAGWIMDAQAMKPGNLMPPMNLSGDELQAVLAYIEILN